MRNIKSHHEPLPRGAMPRYNAAAEIASGFADSGFIANGGATNPDLPAKAFARRATCGSPRKHLERISHHALRLPVSHDFGGRAAAGSQPFDVRVQPHRELIAGRPGIITRNNFQ
jgi:hypothetical protein